MRIALGATHYHVDQLDLDLIATWRDVLQARGVYERALLRAYVNTNHAHWSQAAISELFRHADPARLRATGDRLPSWAGPSVTIFQGGSARCADAGLSWTLDVEQARPFAKRYPDPAIWSGIVAEPEILAYVNVQEEQEILVWPEHVHDRRRLRT